MPKVLEVTSESFGQLFSSNATSPPGHTVLRPTDLLPWKSCQLQSLIMWYSQPYHVFATMLREGCA